MPVGANALIATHSGLRERPGAGLSREAVADAVGGILSLLELRGLPRTLAVARDERPSGELLAADVVQTALDDGAEVVDLGVQPTPAAKLAARSRGLGGAVIVTGSHLAPELNGLKLVAAPTYAPLDVGGLPKATDTADARSGPRGDLRIDGGATAEHLAAIRDAVDTERIRAAGISATVTGSAGPGPRMLLEQLGCLRPGSPAAIGLRLDADGDRLQLVDESGAPLDPELTLALVLVALDARTVVKSADTSRMIDALARDRGGAVRTVPPGEIHLVSALAEGGGDLAGEGNGGVVVPAAGLARDGLAAGAVILSLLARTGRPLSELAAELPRYERRRSSVTCADPAVAAEALGRVGTRFGTSPEDPAIGLCVESGGGAWGLVRPSATEPVIRVRAEALTRVEAEALHSELRCALEAELARA